MQGLSSVGQTFSAWIDTFPFARLPFKWILLISPHGHSLKQTSSGQEHRGTQYVLAWLNWIERGPADIVLSFFL